MLNRYKAMALKSAFSRLPIPGRFLNSALRYFKVDVKKIAIPQICDDRWNRIKINISDPSDLIQKHIFFQGYYEYYESNFVANNLSRGQVFLDIGANIGWHSLIAAHKVGTRGKVVALEPVSRTFKALTANILLNKFDQIHPFRVGLSARSTTVNIYQCDPNNCGMNSLYGNQLIEEIQIMEGDSFLRDIGVSNIDLCKIDVEGAECEVLDGLTETLSKRRIAKILIEANSTSLTRAGRSSKELIARLTDFGFQLRDVRGGNVVSPNSRIDGSTNIIGEL